MHTRNQRTWFSLHDWNLGRDPPGFRTRPHPECERQSGLPTWLVRQSGFLGTGDRGLERGKCGLCCGAVERPSR